MDITAQKFDITVIFDPSQTAADPFSYEVDGAPQGPSFSVDVDQEIGLVILRLYTSGDGENAVFATDPVQWLSDSLAPIPTPQGLSVSRNSEDRVTIVDLNAVAVGQLDLHFEISVMYQGTTYTSADPTIINTPITGGPPDIAAKSRAAAELFIS